MHEKHGALSDTALIKHWRWSRDVRWACQRASFVCCCTTIESYLHNIVVHTCSTTINKLDKWWHPMCTNIKPHHMSTSFKPCNWFKLMQQSITTQSHPRNNAKLMKAAVCNWWRVSVGVGEFVRRSPDKVWHTWQISDRKVLFTKSFCLHLCTNKLQSRDLCWIFHSIQ